MIGILDYGAGNLLSVRKALEYLEAPCRIIEEEEDLHGIRKLILPGVGAFEAALQKLRDRGLYEAAVDWIRSDRPFLGICLGMQLLFEESEESDGVAGFELFKGKVVRFRSRKIPQIGWNQVKLEKQSYLMEGIEDLSFFYFLHGYFIAQENKDIVVGTTEYGNVYPSIIEKGNICAVQFHPEKSGEAGMRLLRNWVGIC